MTAEPSADLDARFHTRFRSQLADQGAVFAETAPGPPQHFGDAAAERDAAETRNVVFPWMDRALIRARGADRAKFLHNFCTNDIKGLESGRACEAFVTDIKSHILGHLLVYATDDALLISSAAGVRERLLEHFNRYVITEDTEFEDASQQYLQLILHSPTPTTPTDDDAMWHSAALAAGGHEIAAIRVPVWNGHTRLLLVPAAAIQDVWNGLLQQDVQPIGSDAAEDLRIQAGFPTDGVDLDSAMLAQEADRNSQAISFTKGCYLGQEPIARIDALGHVNRVLRQLEILAEAFPLAGTPVRNSAGTEIGQLRSVSPLVRSGHRAALAVLRTQHAAPGTPLQIAAEPLPLNARVR